MFTVPHCLSQETTCKLSESLPVWSRAEGTVFCTLLKLIIPPHATAALQWLYWMRESCFTFKFLCTFLYFYMEQFKLSGIFLLPDADIQKSMIWFVHVVLWGTLQGLKGIWGSDDIFVCTSFPQITLSTLKLPLKVKGRIKIRGLG